VRFVEHPVRAFLRRRLGMSVADFSDELDDGLPVELDGLERWGVGQRMLDARRSGADARAAYRAEIARGALPPGQLGVPVIRNVLPIVEDIVGAAHEIVGDGTGTSVDVRVALKNGRSLSGTVPGVTGDVLLALTYSRVKPKQRLAAWVRLLALTAAHPEREFEAVTIGQARSQDARLTIARIKPIEAGDARARLETLVDLYDRGMREPLPLACEASAAYASSGNPEAAAARAWESSFNFDKEDREREHRLVYGKVLTFEELFAFAPHDDECGEGWDESEATRFGRYAARLWDGLSGCEDVDER
jgi:exodeoxyribonuclease V gamma subunit